MKKLFLIFGVIIAVVLVICAFNYQWFYYHFYPFERITGEFEISVNGENLNAFDEYFEYENEGKVRLENDTKNFKIDGNGYGRYEIGFVVSDKELYEITKDEKFKNYGDVELKVVYFNLNSWNISELDIDIDIVKENDDWYACYELELEEPTEEYELVTSELSSKIKLDEAKITGISIGI